jgi:hypothetical protein
MMQKDELKMNPFMCAFGVSASRFLDFIINEYDIEIDPKRRWKLANISNPQYNLYDKYYHQENKRRRLHMCVCELMLTS